MNSELSAEELDFLRKLRELSEPLTLKEIAKRFGMDYYEVVRLMWKLTKMGIVKCFLRTDECGELVAKYVAL